MPFEKYGHSQFFNIYLFKEVSPREQSHPHSYTHAHLEAAQYEHHFICQPLSSCTGAVEGKGLAQGNLSCGNERGASAAFSLSPLRLILPV